MAKSEKPWEPKWIIEKNLPGGGQCLNYIVAPIENKNDKYVLKVLKDYTNIERRTRFYREVHINKSINHPNIPAITDHNCETPEGDGRMYFTYPYIEGTNLEDFIETSGRLNLNSAIVLVKKLSDILAHIHERDIIHRDFKPDNIILRNNRVDDPVLIDFGLSVIITDKALIESGQKQLGNRFFYLPELKHDGGNKRDKRSDLTYLVGIFFFVLTGAHPAHPLDENGRYPHQRVKLSELISGATEAQLLLINSFFDKGFQNQLNFRFQSIEHFVTSLNTIQMTNNDEPNFDEILKASVSEDLLRMENALIALKPNFDRIFREITTSISSNYKNISVGVQGPTLHTHWDPMCLWGNYILKDKFKMTEQHSYQLQLYQNGSEYLISVKNRGNETILERFGTRDEVDFNKVKENIYKYILADYAVNIRR